MKDGQDDVIGQQSKTISARLSMQERNPNKLERVSYLRILFFQWYYYSIQRSFILVVLSQWNKYFSVKLMKLHYDAKHF